MPSVSTKKTHAVTMYDLADAKYYSNGWRAVSYSQADMTNSLRKRKRGRPDSAFPHSNETVGLEADADRAQSYAAC